MVHNADGSKTLVEADNLRLTEAQRRAEFELKFGDPLTSDSGRALETAFEAANLSNGVRAYARYYADALTELNRISGDPNAAARIIQQMDGLSTDAAENLLRRELRSATVDAIKALDPQEQMAALQRAADALPSNRPRGELFTAFRGDSMPAGFSVVTPGTNGLNIAATGRQADGVIDIRPGVINGQLGPQDGGRFLVEDKFGQSFNLEQARAYSAAIDEAGSIAARNGAQHDGVVYVFTDATQAARAVEQLAGLDPSIHVALLKEPGNLDWLR